MRYSVYSNPLGLEPTRDNYEGGNLTSTWAKEHAMSLARRCPDRVVSLWDESIGWLRWRSDGRPLPEYFQPTTKENRDA